MDGDAELTQCLRDLLATELSARELDHLVLQKVKRNRSSIYFVDLDGPTRERRWVVKQPDVTVAHADLEPPLAAADQFAAHQRLYEYLRRMDAGVLTPRPVGVMADVNAYAMEFVPGRIVSRHVALRSVRHPQDLLDGAAASAKALRLVHSLEPAQAEAVHLGDLAAELQPGATQIIRAAGLRAPEWRFRDDSSAPTAMIERVVLHGDFAPENILLGASGTYCLDAALVSRGWAERDVVRYLVMLYQENFFIRAAVGPAAQRLRRRAGATFLDAYYDGPWPASLQPLVLHGIAVRYARRKALLARLSYPKGPARRALEQYYFQRLLDEVAAPDYFERLRSSVPERSGSSGVRT